VTSYLPDPKGSICCISIECVSLTNLILKKRKKINLSQRLIHKFFTPSPSSCFLVLRLRLCHGTVFDPPLQVWYVIYGWPINTKENTFWRLFDVFMTFLSSVKHGVLYVVISKVHSPITALTNNDFTHTYAQTHMHKHIHTHTHMYTHTRAHTHTHIHTHAHTYTHTSTFIVHTYAHKYTQRQTSRHAKTQDVMP